MRYLCVVFTLLTESFHMLFMLITVTFDLIQVLGLKRKNAVADCVIIYDNDNDSYDEYVNGNDNV